MLDSRFIKFRLDHTKTKHLAIGAVVSSEDIPAGGHLWRVNCYPRGCREEDRGEHLSIYLQLVSDSNSVLAIFDAFAMGADGTPSWCDGHRRAHLYPARGATRRGGNASWRGPTSSRSTWRRTGWSPWRAG